MTWLSQISDFLGRAWAYLSSGRTLAIVFGVGFALLAITLLIASRTKWGQSKPLTKCLVLSVLAHVWLLMYALGNRPVLPQGDPRGIEQNISISFDESMASYSPPAAEAIESTEGQQEQAAGEPQPWERPVAIDQLPKPPALEALDSRDLPRPLDLLPTLEPTPMPALPPPELLADLVKTEAVSEQSSSHDSSKERGEESSSQMAETLPATPSVTVPVTAPPTQPGLESATPLAPIQTVTATQSPILPPESQLTKQSRVPADYRLRQAANRLQLAAAYGADADSEAAVKAGLEWLVRAQSADGSWNAKNHGGGTETYALGEYRHGTGDQADTGVSGLALLAFLSAGHTHLEGDYQQTVQGGLRYLLHAQMPSGDLSGPKQVGGAPNVTNARMYCHSIATLALAEAYGMTRDAFLRESLLRAAQYSINAQDVRGGGWRYRPGDPGDLSQFGWQAMALKSVQRSGIQVPIEVQRRMRRFLDSCAAGQAGGLARYRPGEGRPSETMTAEALACRLLLDYPTTLEAQREATTMILANRPGTSEDNVYFWYYATLALFQLQDENWRVWNQAMKQRLLATQIPAYGQEPGSWNPDALWGGYGGRIYSTAMSCLCLEVYYRYLPMYQRANLARTPRGGSYNR